MHSQYNIQYGTISYYNPIDCSGIVKSNKEHFFFDQSTTIPINAQMSSNLEVAFTCINKKSKKINFLCSKKSLYEDHIQKLIAQLYLVIEPQGVSSFEASIRKKGDPKPQPQPEEPKFNFSKLSTIQKSIVIFLFSYSIITIFFICLLERFDGLGVVSFLLLIIPCFMSVVLFKNNEEKLNIIMLLLINFMSISPIITGAGHEIYKMTKLAFANINSFSGKTYSEQGILLNKYYETRGKARRSWENIELNIKPDQQNLTLFCNFIDRDDSCPQLKQFDQKEAKIIYTTGYSYLKYPEVILLGIKTSEYDIQPKTMINNYKYQQQTIWFFFGFVVFPAIIFMPAISLYQYMHEKKSSKT
ncbi:MULTISPECIES: hypothetical protein [unclassified Acinetobacter]|uniref:Transmembrane protein n=1 Tax=Acinetobacter corruptisaponis TaxID=3045147 RepID=A0ABY8S0S1_9GAMM|nr:MULTISPECIES: hypothetical protein [unclassified Acinetobacter]MDH0030863.1 hypothetical protein [Acinetobacter sp. GD04021]MDH0886364.1 hypothetical protein [Acinetobacter sp. GD03873]MDH1082886.1 hypothetical protein [Acinetobacter sp. GD03983]MDH2189912.1 hypothetical protein [Acinetobacter sp. GD03645]MDH2203065.1 hypothetical protein [Acinetobacter sp. GD03647]